MKTAGIIIGVLMVGGAVVALSNNASASNAAIAVIDFGGTKTSTNGDYTIQFPTADASNAIIRIA